MTLAMMPPTVVATMRRQEGEAGLVHGARVDHDMKSSIVRSANLPSLSWAKQRLNTVVKEASTQWHFPDIEVPCSASDPQDSTDLSMRQVDPVVIEFVEYSRLAAHYDWHTDDHAVSVTVQLSPDSDYQGGTGQSPIW